MITLCFFIQKQRVQVLHFALLFDFSILLNWWIVVGERWAVHFKTAQTQCVDKGSVHDGQNTHYLCARAIAPPNHSRCATAASGEMLYFNFTGWLKLGADLQNPTWEKKVSLFQSTYGNQKNQRAENTTIGFDMCKVVCWGLNADRLQQQLWLCYWSLYKTIQRSFSFPKAWSVIEGDIRRSLVKRFPYGVLYSEENDEIYIIAVMHLHRFPGYWKHRKWVQAYNQEELESGKEVRCFLIFIIG